MRKKFSNWTFNPKGEAMNRAKLTRIALAFIITAVLVVPTAWTQTAALQKVKINFPTRSGASWPMFVAKDGGYYQKYGLDVELVFGAGVIGVAMITSGDAVMTNSSMEQALQASSRDPGALIATGSSLNKGLFALMAAKNIGSIKDLKGKRLAVSQVGDAPYNYTLALLAKSKLTARDVQWVTVGTDATARAVALTTGRADATLLTAPQYFKIEEQGYKSLANLADYNDIYASTVYLLTKKAVTANPKLPEILVKAHAEAIKRILDDKPFAVKSYMNYDPSAAQADVEKIYDRYKNGNLFEKIPYVQAAAVKAIVDQAAEQTATQIKAFDLRTFADNSTIDRLVKEGFFEKLFGSNIKSEEDRKSKLALR
jgi:NitT/TauT family transport system substrate-binding protein